MSDIHPLAGRVAPPELLTDIGALDAAFHSHTPDLSQPTQRVSFGTSGHRGTSLNGSFTESHIAAITQAVCNVRRREGITGPLFLGIDTHALSISAFACTLEVLAANGATVMLSDESEYTPTPAISHAILHYNRERTTELADGIVLSPSHNPPTDGGLKYNPPNGGPADTVFTKVIEQEANRLLESGNADVKRIGIEKALAAATTHRAPIMDDYVRDLGSVIDFAIIRNAGLRAAVDPLGGAGVHYWPRIAEVYGIDLDVLRSDVDTTFRFMSVDWDGRIRMDPSSAYAMQPLIARCREHDITFACDTDHDRHGIVTPTGGLVPSNDYLAVAIDYLLQHRPHWSPRAGVGKTLVSSSMIDRVVAFHGRALYEVPVGFKWFVDGLMNRSLCFVGEESAGATLVRFNGDVWTTDKDGIVAALLSAEITARTGADPSQHYQRLAEQFGAPVSTRVEAHAALEQRQRLSRLSAADFTSTEIAGERVIQVLDRAPGNGAPIGGLKVVTESAWFAARPSGTESIYKIYAESFRGPEHLASLVAEAQALVDAVIA